MMAKTKLGGLVGYQCVEATGVDLAPDTADGRMVCMPRCRLNERIPLVAYSMCVCVCVCVCANAAAACFPSWQCLPGIIHGTHPISRSACATHVFLFNLLVFSSSATTRTLPAIFFPARDKRIPDVRGWNVPSPPPHPFPSSCAVTSLRQPLHSHSLLSPSFPLFCFPEACPSLVRYVGTLSCAHLPPAPTG